MKRLANEHFTFIVGLEIPLPRLTDFVFTGEQLPWKLKLDQFSIFTVLGESTEAANVTTSPNNGRKGKPVRKPWTVQCVNHVVQPSANTGTIAISASGENFQMVVSLLLFLLLLLSSSFRHVLVIRHR